MSCVGFIFDRLKEFGYQKKTVKKCITKTAEKTGLTAKKVCSLIKRDLLDIEEACISRYSNSKPLKDYQSKVIDFMMKNRGVVASFDLGLGKTLTAIATAECLRKEAKYFGKELEIYVITSPTLQENFKKEIRSVGVKETNYIFYPTQTFVNRYREGKIDCSNKLIIIDEAHNLRTDYRGEYGAKAKKSEKGYNAKNVIECTSKAWKVLLLTATPAYNMPHDVVNLVAMVKGNTIPMKNERFKKALSSEVEFKNTFGRVFAFKHQESKKDYPERSDKMYWIIMPRDYLKEYENIENEYWSRDRIKPKKKKPKTEEEEEKKKKVKKEKDKYSFMSELRRATINLRKPTIGEGQEEESFFKNPKIDTAIKIIKEGRKTVVYSEYVKSGIDQVKKRLDEEGIRFLAISKDDKPVARARVVNKFNRSKKINVLLISKVGREGIDLVGVRDVVLLEKGWVKAAEEQVVGRGIRLKSHANLPESERHVLVHHLIMIKPKDTAYIESEPPTKYHESADLYLHKYALKKDQANKSLLARLENVDIFHGEC